LIPPLWTRRYSKNDNHPSQRLPQPRSGEQFVMGGDWTGWMGITADE
jgi:hypothetical protein